MTQVAAGNPWSHANYTGRGAEPEPLPSQKSPGSGCVAWANLCSWEDGGGGAGALGRVQAAATRSAGRTGRPGECGAGSSGGRPGSGRRRGSGERRPGKALPVEARHQAAARPPPSLCQRQPHRCSWMSVDSSLRIDPGPTLSLLTGCTVPNFVHLDQCSHPNPVPQPRPPDSQSGL
ncbi:hypothetical protein J1605_014902 [Eschrichtius robustus]|uniref:Uncharacterized protein n=1 Tax=Eschrichtius robustus TaxID=9764 RepID=A0AB34GD31_ESCRO|nr:hypothetical protein J1605_014902 [Eschrichtius robustus]